MEGNLGINKLKKLKKQLQTFSDLQLLLKL